MTKKILIFGVMLIMSLGLFSACGKVELQTGVYENENKTASVTLLENNVFEFNRSITTSYLPTGSYSIEKKTLILYVEEGEEYIFNIKKGELSLISGLGVGTLLEEGTVFKLTKKAD